MSFTRIILMARHGLKSEEMPRLARQRQGREGKCRLIEAERGGVERRLVC